MLKKFRFIMGLLILGIALLVAGCSNDKAVEPGANPENQVQAVEEKVALGSSYDIVTKLWGAPTQEIEPYKDGFGMVDFNNGYYQTTFIDEKLANVKVVFEKEKGAGRGVPFSEAEKIVADFMPKDARLVRQFDKDIAPAKGKVIVYKSGLLANMFTKESFISAEPGIFMAYYKSNEQDQVFAVLVALGDNP